MDSGLIKSGGRNPAGNNKIDIQAIIQATKIKMFDQLCLLVLDGSGSMSDQHNSEQTKADATIAAVKGLVHTLKQSSKSDGFSLAVLTYDENAYLRVHPQPINNINPENIDLGRSFGAGRATRIDRALNEAHRIVAKFLSEQAADSHLQRDVRILLMSDGYCHQPEQTRIEAGHINDTFGKRVRICCCLFCQEDEPLKAKAESLMKDIAGRNDHGELCYTQTSNPVELRSFFEKSSTED